jgi:hypothetical protein
MKGLLYSCGYGKNHITSCILWLFYPDPWGNGCLYTLKIYKETTKLPSGGFFIIYNCKGDNNENYK